MVDNPMFADEIDDDAEYALASDPSAVSKDKGIRKLRKSVSGCGEVNYALASSQDEASYQSMKLLREDGEEYALASNQESTDPAVFLSETDDEYALASDPSVCQIITETISTKILSGPT